MCNMCRSAIAIWSPEEVFDEFEHLLELAETVTCMPHAHLVATDGSPGKVIPLSRREKESHAQ